MIYTLVRLLAGIPRLLAAVVVVVVLAYSLGTACVLSPSHPGSPIHLNLSVLVSN